MSSNLKKAQDLYGLLLLHGCFEHEWEFVRLSKDGSVTLAKDDQNVVIRLAKNNGPEHLVADVNGHRVISYSVSGLADLLSGLGSYVTIMNQSSLSL
jgi:hypothetical protein